MPRHLKTRNALAIRSGYIDFDGVGLAVSSPFLQERLAVPRDVWLGDTPEGEPAICWCVPPNADKHGVTQDWARGGTGSRAFWRFLELADEQRPERFVSFAQEFGVLGLWPYREPRGSKILGIDFWPPSTAEGIFTPRRGVEHALYYRLKADGNHAEAERLSEARYEPIEEWRRWVTWFRAALTLAFELREGRAGHLEHWEALGWDIPVTVADGQGSRRLVSVEVQRRELTRIVQRLFLKWSGLVPKLDWGEGGPGLSLALGGKEAVHMPRWSMQFDWPPNTLYPALVAQLLAVITAGPTAIASCSTCGRLHPRSRKIRTDQPAYCDICREEAIRDNKARSAAKRRAQGRKT